MPLTDEEQFILGQMTIAGLYRIRPNEPVNYDPNHFHQTHNPPWNICEVCHMDMTNDIDELVRTNKAYSMSVDTRFTTKKEWGY